MSRPVAGASIVAVCVALSASLAGCAASAKRAEISGTVKLCGGPRSGCFTEPVHVLLIDARRQVVARASTNTGKFAFDVTPGAYTVQAKAYPVNGSYVLGTVLVHAAAGPNRVVHITDGDVF